MVGSVRGSLMLAAAMLGACTAVPGLAVDVEPTFKPDPRNPWPKQNNGSGFGVRLKRNSGPMTEEDVRASAERAKANKPQRPFRSRKAKRKKQGG